MIKIFSEYAADNLEELEVTSFTYKDKGSYYYGSFTKQETQDVLPLFLTCGVPVRAEVLTDSKRYILDSFYIYKIEDCTFYWIGKLYELELEEKNG